MISREIKEMEMLAMERAIANKKYHAKKQFALVILDPVGNGKMFLAPSIHELERKLKEHMMKISGHKDRFAYTYKVFKLYGEQGITY